MKKGLCFVCICFCIALCACQGRDVEITYLDKYGEIFAEAGAKRVTLIYLDEDSVPELLFLKDGEYHLYTFDGTDAKEIMMSDPEIKMNAYGPCHIVEEHDRNQRFYWFEYVPYKGLVRVHDGMIQEVDDIMRYTQERHDYYLKYADGLLEKELEAESRDYGWHTYDALQEIENEEFLDQLSTLGYDQLVACGCMYGTVADAYEHIGTRQDAQKVLEDFVNGKTDAVDYVEGTGDIPEDSFVMRSYEDFYNWITSEDDAWGSAAYMDFDNDGEEELVMCGYCNSCVFFDVIGDTVYRLLETTSTTDVGNVVEMDGTRAIARTDLGHTGRQIYRITRYDSCGCIIDWFVLSAGYEGSSYSIEDEFMYRGREITMEEFEAILDSIAFIDHGAKPEVFFPIKR